MKGLEQALSTLGTVPLSQDFGKLCRVTGLLLEVSGCPLAIGQRCEVATADKKSILAEVVGFNRELTYLMPLHSLDGLRSGARVLPSSQLSRLTIGEEWLGRVFNGLGEPVDGKGPAMGNVSLPLRLPRISALDRRPISLPLDVGVRAINGLLTLGRGQRVGLMAGSGVGKSVLLGMMARATDAQIVVVGLIGERGREVNEFLLHTLGEEGLKKAIVIAAPADESPLMRLKATELCHTIAAFFRDQGFHVLLMIDSLTRYAMAQREIALSLGEAPATKGYPASVFSLIPRLVETAGNSASAGSLTAIYTVLAEGDDQQDPIVDAARAVLDGHIVLSRTLAERGHFPAIDIGQSVSRCMNLVTTVEHRQAARRLKQHYARYQEIKPMIALGGYIPGADREVDRAVEQAPQILQYLQQDDRQLSLYTQSLDELLSMPQGE
ncbi:FliI/YscN family ATPase [Rosenbergiella collisarenosi]|uniref:FliI/YscN family ATPase n=1 Tax=Rosenbergiella collisarenosi TaxID=1544695 RepID=UPI001BD9CD17|nr:FliI/YscN family ATPase [Rosenbergiella collisarenosi]MBT0721897.1 FliI/YscN family ATPase [Rosenbergiella collisarenosi]